MAKGIENIGKRDVAWSYASTIVLMGAGVILLPFILRKMSSEAVGIWNIFNVITMLVAILDFGFRPTFARNLSYIFSGVKTLLPEGVQTLSNEEKDRTDAEVDYGLLKGGLVAMKRFYQWIALAAFGLLATAGTAYFFYILNKYTGNRTDAIVAWCLLISINCYSLYTQYYDALLLGKGYVLRSQQITIVGQVLYLLTAIGLIYAGLGLSAIVAAQLLSIVVRRLLSYRVFFTQEMEMALAEAQTQDPKLIMKAIYPNAVKIGLTQVGAFGVNKSSMLIGSAFLSLEEVACYGITMQVLEVLCHCATVPYKSFLPKLAQFRAANDIAQLRRYYLINVASIVSVYLVGGFVCVLFGNPVLELIGSQTMFVPTSMLIALIVIHFLEENHASAAGFIMADNKIPFFIPSLVSGAATILLLWIFMGPFHWGLWGMIMAPGIAQAAYQNWKWPSMLIRELWGKSTEP